MSEFSEQLRRLRKEQEMTQGELAKAAYVNKNLIGQYERGMVEPTRPVLVSLANALGVDLNTLNGKWEQHD